MEQYFKNRKKLTNEGKRKRKDGLRKNKNITNPRKYSRKVNLLGRICKGGELSLKIIINIMGSYYYVGILNSNFLK